MSVAAIPIKFALSIYRQAMRMHRLERAIKAMLIESGADPNTPCVDFVISRESLKAADKTTLELSYGEKGSIFVFLKPLDTNKK